MGYFKRWVPQIGIRFETITGKIPTLKWSESDGSESDLHWGTDIRLCFYVMGQISIFIKQMDI